MLRGCQSSIYSTTFTILDTEAQISQIAAFSNYLGVKHSVERPSAAIQQAGNRMAKPGTADQPAVKGSQACPSAKKDSIPTSQKVILSKKPTEPARPDKVCTEDSWVAFCIKPDSEAVIAKRPCNI